jgi:hypothetical protein
MEKFCQEQLACGGGNIEEKGGFFSGWFAKD